MGVSTWVPLAGKEEKEGQKRERCGLKKNYKTLKRER